MMIICLVLRYLCVFGSNENGSDAFIVKKLNFGPVILSLQKHLMSDILFVAKKYGKTLLS